MRVAMKRILLVLSMAIAIAAPAAADAIHVLYANTLTLTDTQGGVTTVLLEEDGKFEQTNARGMWAAGFWVKLDSRFCMTARGEAEICFPLEADKSVGDSWEIRGPTGRLVWTARIDDGRADFGSGGAPARTP
jgi:hypothetical protein